MCANSHQGLAPLLYLVCIVPMSSCDLQWLYTIAMPPPALCEVLEFMVLSMVVLATGGDSHISPEESPSGMHS